MQEASPLITSTPTQTPQTWQPTPPEASGNDWVMKDAIHILNLLITLCVFGMGLAKEFNVSECLVYKSK